MEIKLEHGKDRWNMGAIVRIAKMPAKCSECLFANEEVTYCRLRDSRIICGKQRESRMALCPLVNEGDYLTKTLRLLKLRK